ncbi:MAG: hypothetical protein KME43_15155 [Myxacorys chilensis ATA2-1-KO14]|nr:hypothetical protein [Myxacorys chilensis ATA2-1-KO14]
MMWEERVESIKAGGVSLGAVAAIFPLTLLINQVAVLQGLAEPVAPRGGLSVLGMSDLQGWVSFAIALFTGFLFGITYRYVIRQDPNLHLRSGAVLAFGLVRGLAQIDVGLTTQGSLFPFVILAGESIVLFAIARLVLDWAMVQKWVKPFP